MRSRNEISKILAIPLAVAAGWAALGGARALAKGDREFTGFYRILRATNQGDKVEVRIALRIFNYSGADVQDAIISLIGSLPPSPGAAEAGEKEQPAFRGVALHVNVRQVPPPLEGTFSVPASEYARWQKGAGPHFVISYQDASGMPRLRPIELTRRP